MVIVFQLFVVALLAMSRVRWHQIWSLDVEFRRCVEVYGLTAQLVAVLGAIVDVVVAGRSLGC